MATAVRSQYVQQWLQPSPVGTNDFAVVFRPRIPPAWSPGLIHCHGTNAVGYGATEMFGFQALGLGLAQLASLGWTVVAPDIGDRTLATGDGSGPANWGNHTATNRIEAWRQWMVSQGVAASKICLSGYSMGGYTSLAYVRDYRAKVAAVAGWDPCLDADTFRFSRDDPGHTLWPVLADGFDAAWSLTSTTPTPAAANLYTNTAITGIPWIGYYSTDDPIIPSSWVTRMAAWIGASATAVSVGAHNHLGPIEMPNQFDVLASWYADHMIGVT